MLSSWRDFPRVREARDDPDDVESALFAAKFSAVGVEGFTSLTNSWNGIYEIGLTVRVVSVYAATRNQAIHRTGSNFAARPSNFQVAEMVSTIIYLANRTRYKSQGINCGCL